MTSPPNEPSSGKARTVCDEAVMKSLLKTLKESRYKKNASY